MEQYDIIIAGGGAAGLSMAYYLSLSPSLQQQKILLLDKDLKQQNDRTWGFWTKEATAFETIVSYDFPQAEFISASFSSLLPLAPYKYQVIEGIRFYRFVKNRLAQFPNIHFRQAEITGMESFEDFAHVKTTQSIYQAPWVFNSCFLEEEIKKAVSHGLYLQQHFKGWTIKTPKAVFDTGTIRLFDFRTPQEGAMRFFYLIPQATDMALVEYTLFSATLLAPNAYDTALKEYIHNVLQLKEYEVIAQEWGSIPMASYPFPSKKGNRIMNIGSVGGASKPSTGYTFLRIQQQCKKAIQLLEKQEVPDTSIPTHARFRLYDDMLLNIMDKKGGCSEEIFSQLFARNPIQRILKFLDEDTHLGEELLIMNSVPRKKFIKSFLNLKLRTQFT